MDGEPQSTEGRGAQDAETTASATSWVPRTATRVVWTLFLLSVATLVLAVFGRGAWSVPGVIAVDGLTVVMWVVVTFFSGIVHSYSRRYMAGDRHLDGFFARILAFTLVVMAMTAADHVALFVATWLGMGLLMASLIGHERDWVQAQAAAGLARRYFLASTALLAVGLATLALATETTSIAGIVGAVETIPRALVVVAIGTILLAAVIQSALFPFHGWIMSSMTAPTPASALMHAGFVNAGGILLTRFAPVFTAELAAMAAIAVVGAVSALLGQALALVQTDVKRKLGSSTVAQMGFMILQCGLGFFSAAIAHLILHGCYKAYLFLSSGAGVERTTPKHAKTASLGLPSAVVSLATAAGGGLLFLTLTGKGGEVALDSGLILTLVVVLTTLHAGRDILRRTTLSPTVRLVCIPAIVLTAISAYALLFNAVSTMLAGVPMTSTPTDLTPLHALVAGLFVAAYVVMELGWHRSSERLYVTLLNLSQPAPSTVLTRTEEYND
ncbi:NADH dehydrogenase [Halorubrum gandharaense]